MDYRSFDPRWLLETNPDPMRLGPRFTRVPAIFVRPFIRAHPLTINDLIGCEPAELRISNRYSTFARAGDICLMISAHASCSEKKCSESDGTNGNANSFGRSFPARKQAHWAHFAAV